MAISFKILKKKAWSIVVKNLQDKAIYPCLYMAYWHCKMPRPKKSANGLNYFSAAPNSGAGIGHQIANWISGYWFAKLFELEFAHIPFSNERWESFLGLGENEISVTDLIKKKGYKKISLPLFDEFNQKQVELIKKMIRSYEGREVVFVAEQDQFYRDQFGVVKELNQRFHQAKARKNDRIIYSNKNFNIAIHVRRGDIVVGQENKNVNLLMRWQDNNYFTKVLETVISNIEPKKPIAIYLFSQGTEQDFNDFVRFSNLHLCLEMNPIDSFLHMINADILISSKSSFSYKPALLNRGTKICPGNFWHGYPQSEDFILADDAGNFDTRMLKGRS